MQLKKLDIGVWVKASERLPYKLFGTIARFSHTKTVLYDFVEWVRNSPDKLNEIEWNEDIKDVYVLTEDELEKFSNVMVNKLIDLLPVGEVTTFELIKSVKLWCDNQKQFIESITKQQ